MVLGLFVVAFEGGGTVVRVTFSDVVSARPTNSQMVTESRKPTIPQLPWTPDAFGKLRNKKKF